ncbi:MAG: hypothetical protein K2P26_00570, partial [Oscillospiraceae bacterium]|nr:hypothetical protein [Oscillospiraceae bacterium]
LQGKTTQYGGKKTGQTAFNGCEYRFLKKTSAQKAHTYRLGCGLYAPFAVLRLSVLRAYLQQARL